jgi:hypothetical protein
VRIEGGDLGVAISPSKGDARTLVLGVRHRDAGTHAFDVAFGTGEGWVQAGSHCNATPPASAVEYRCNSFVPGTGEGQGSLVVTPRFAAAKRYSLRATRHGRLVIDTAGLEGAYTIEDFEGLEEATKYETLEVQVAYGAVRPDALSVTIRHEGRARRGGAHRRLHAAGGGQAALDGCESLAAQVALPSSRGVHRLPRRGRRHRRRRHVRRRDRPLARGVRGDAARRGADLPARAARRTG